MNSVTLYRIDPDRNMQRFYRLDIQRDLFGNECLIYEWGRVGGIGKTKVMSFATLNEAEREMERKQRIKVKRGYRV